MSGMSDLNLPLLRKLEGDNVLMTEDEAAELVDVVARGNVPEITRWIAEHPGAVTAAATFEEQKHPRHRKGVREGGRFAPKSGGTETEEQDQEPEGTVPGLQEGSKEDQRLLAGVDYFEKGPVAQELLGDAEDTESLYYDHETGQWDPERLKLHDDIVNHFLAGANGVSYEEPYSLFMAGGSGAGKSTVMNDLEAQGKVPPNAVYVNPDDIKEMLPEYQAMKDAGDKYGAWAVHEESSAIAKRLVTEATIRDYNMIVDGTGDSGEGKFLGKINDALGAGRYAKVILIDAPTDQTQIRAYNRAIDQGRWIPPAEINRVHQSVAERHFQWADQVDDWEVWATDWADTPARPETWQPGTKLPEGTQQKPWKVARRIGGVTTIYDSPRYEYLRRKAADQIKPGEAFERNTNAELTREEDLGEFFVQK